MEDDDLSALIRRNATRHRADALLKSSVLAEIALQNASGENASGEKRPRATPPVSKFAWRGWFGLGSSFASGAVATLAVVLMFGQPTAPPKQGTEVVNSHIRALMAEHLTDVASTDQHTVKPWFQGKLSYSPPVRDFTAQGFPLVGGRLDYLDGRPVAALVYRHGKHAINVFVWPGDAASSSSQEQQGFHVRHWAQDGMQFWAVSDVNAADLGSLERLWTQP
ncbi:MAG TPA: anti-sigma factor [Burkholderiaceae bacterium]